MSVVKIAEHAGVSVATVSRVLNGHPRVRPDSVRAVKRAASKLNYSLPPRRSRERSSGRRRTLAMLQIGRQSPIDIGHTGSLVQEGAAAAASDLGCTLCPQWICEDGDLERLDADGYLLGGIAPTQTMLDFFATRPSVWISSYRSGRRRWVIPGNEQIGVLAFEYLYRQGHHRVAVFNPFADHPVLDARSVFFQHAAEEAGLDVAIHSRRSPVTSGLPPRDAWHRLEAHLAEMVGEVLGAADAPTGLFVPLTTPVAPLYRVLAQRGQSIGPDLDIVTCGGAEEVVNLYPRPAIVDIAPQLMARRAVEMLLAQIDAPDTGRRTSVVIEPELIGSEVPPRKSST